MSKVMTVICLVLMIFSIIVGTFLFYVTSTLNNEASLRNRVIKQEKVVKLYYDKLWKVIAQKTQTTKASSDLQKELVDSLVSGRDATFIKVITENNPESAFDRSQFISLSNSIEGQREGFFREQSEWVDMVREHHTMFDKMPSGFFLTVFGRVKTEEPKLITSSQTDSVAESGKEEDISLEL